MYSALSKEIHTNNNFNYLMNKKNLTLSNQNFEKDISECKFSVFSRTSAGPQAVNYGLLSLWSDFSLVGSNALFGKIDLFFPSFDKESFINQIENVSKLNEENILDRLSIQKEITNRIYSKINYEIIDKILI